MIASAIMGLSGLTATAGNLFSYNALGSGAEVRSELLGSSSSASTFELKCGGKKDSSSKMKDHSCGEKAKAKDSKMKDGKCGEGKCGGDKKKETKAAPKNQ